MKLFTALCIFAVVSSTFGAPDVDNHDLLVSPNRDIDLMLQTRQLLEQLVGNLRKSADEALNAVGTFNDGIRREAKEIRDKVVEDLKKFRNRVTDAIEVVMHRVSNTSVAVKECVDSHRGAAATVFNETLSGTMACVDDRIAEIAKEVNGLVSMANDAMSAGAQALNDMKKCTEDNHLLAAGSCLGVVVMKTELKSVNFLTQSSLAMGRININIATLPATLQVCAGSRFIQTGISTGKIIVDIGGCSAVGIFNTIIGRPNVE